MDYIIIGANTNLSFHNGLYQNWYKYEDITVIGVDAFVQSPFWVFIIIFTFGSTRV
jgi:hypothetical protein